MQSFPLNSHKIWFFYSCRRRRRMWSNPFETWFSILGTTAVGRPGSLAFDNAEQYLTSYPDSCLKGATNIHKAEEKSKIYSNPKQFQKSFLWRQRLRRGNRGKIKVVLKRSGNVGRHKNKWKSLGFSPPSLQEGNEIFRWKRILQGSYV